MRHQKAGRKFSRSSSHRKAMFSNMVTSLIVHERIETTEPKAKELRRVAERTITWGTRVKEILAKAPDKRSEDEKAAVVHAVRMAKRVVKDKDALHKLFHDVVPRFGDRAGGYTRVLKTRFRNGDAAPMALIELVERGAEAPAAPEEPVKEAKPKKKAAPKKKAEAAEAAETKAEKTEKKTTKKKAAAKADKTDKKSATKATTKKATEKKATTKKSASKSSTKKK